MVSAFMTTDRHTRPCLPAAQFFTHPSIRYAGQLLCFKCQPALALGKRLATSVGTLLLLSWVVVVVVVFNVLGP
jgi:hypothetical protein